MKRNDITLVLVCIIVSGVLSLVLSNLLFGSSSRQQKIEVVERITPDFTQPDQRYFNSQAINPTQLIQIGNGTNTVQFGQ